MTKNQLLLNKINIANMEINNYCFLPEGIPFFNEHWKVNSSGSVLTKILSFPPDENNSRNSFVNGKFIIKFKTNSLKISTITAFCQKQEVGFCN
jgi:hypothetical protein